MSAVHTFIAKSNPQPGDVYVRPLLTSLAYTYMTQDMARRSAAMACLNLSRVPSALQSSYFTKFSKADILRAKTEPRAASGEFARIGFDVDNSNYFFCKVYGAATEISDELRANYTLQMDLDRSRTMLLSEAGARTRETLFADTLFATSNGFDTVVNGTTGSPTPGTSFKKWNEAAATPIADIKYAARALLDSTGYAGNTMVLPKAVWDTLTESADVIDRLKYTQVPMLTTQAFAQMCGLDRVIVSSFVSNTANKNAANAISNPLGDKALVCYLPDAPGPGVMSAFQTFVWDGMADSVDGMQVRKVRDELRRQDVLQISDAFDIKITCADLGFLFNDCT